MKVDSGSKKSYLERDSAKRFSYFYTFCTSNSGQRLRAHYAQKKLDSEVVCSTESSTGLQRGPQDFKRLLEIQRLNVKQNMPFKEVAC